MNKYNPIFVNAFELFEDKIFEIPVFQRPYSWQKDQIDQLLDDIYKAYINKGDLFLGTLFIRHTKNTNGVNHYEIVDGQQRIVTLSFIFVTFYILLTTNQVNLQKDIYLEKTRKLIWKRHSIPNQALVKIDSIGNELTNLIYIGSLTDPFNLVTRVKGMKIDTKIERNISKAFLNIYRYIETKNTQEFDIPSFIDFVFNKTTFIAIETYESNKNIYEMFEDINSKGKPLEQLDLIKTYIFSRLNENVHEEYLYKWGNLIRSTDDELADYIWVYFKAFFRYYTTSLSAEIFKTILTDNNTKKFYGTNDEEVLLKNMIDDMLGKVKYYRALNSVSSIKNIIVDDRVVFYHGLFVLLRYEHPRPILFRALFEYDNSPRGQVNTAELLLIYKLLTSFMIQFLGINKLDSKDVLPLIKELMNTIYKHKKVNSFDLKYSINNFLLVNHIDRTNFEKKLKEFNVIKNDKLTDLAFAFLMIYYSYYDKKMDFNLLNNLMLNRKNMSYNYVFPSVVKEVSDYPYFNEIDKPGQNVLRLKANADFPRTIVDGMDFENFKQLVIEKVENVRLKQTVPFLPNHQLNRFNELNKSYFAYKAIEERHRQIVTSIIDSDVFYFAAQPAKQNTMVKVPPARIHLLDWNNVDNVVNIRPYMVEINGKKIYVNSNYEAVLVIFRYLHAINPSILSTLINGAFGYGSLSKPWISDQLTKLRVGKIISGTRLYYESNRSAKDHLKFVKEVVTIHFKLDLNDFKINY
jgi:uncharacterized protein with ParB-like and HNH nuclease domain